MTQSLNSPKFKDGTVLFKDDFHSFLAGLRAPPLQRSELPLAGAALASLEDHQTCLPWKKLLLVDGARHLGLRRSKSKCLVGLKNHIWNYNLCHCSLEKTEMSEKDEGRIPGRLGSSRGQYSWVGIIKNICQ